MRLQADVGSREEADVVDECRPRYEIARLRTEAACGGYRTAWPWLLRRMTNVAGSRAVDAILGCEP